MKTLSLFSVKFLLFVIILVSCPASSEATQLARKQSGTVTMSGTSLTVNILAVDLSRSFLVFSATSYNSPAGTNSGNVFIAGALTDVATITFTRVNYGQAATIHWQVFEFSTGVSVQRGTATNVTNTNISLTSVDVSKSFPIVSGVSGSSLNYSDKDAFSAEITSATNLRLTAGATIATAHWQVVQYEDAVVKKVTASVGPSSTASVDVPFSAVTNLDKAMVLSNHEITGNVSLNGAHVPQTKLVDASTVQFARTTVHNEATFSFVAYVIEFTDNTLVERGEITLAAGSQTNEVAINSLPAVSGAFGPGNFGAQVSSNANNKNMGYTRVVYEINTNPKRLTITRGQTATTTTTTAPYQVVAFEREPRTFYSLGSGAWEDNTTWSLTANGSSGVLDEGEFPGRADNVVIKAGHTITVNSLNDNNAPGVKPDDLKQTHIGPNFDGSNTAKFYQTGTIVIKGVLNFSGVGAMLGGYTLVQSGGSLTGTTYIVITGDLEADSGSILTSGDDLVFTGYSTSIINTNSTSADDIIIDNPYATLCGTGATTLQNGSGSQISYFNGAAIKQVCSTYTINCTGSGTTCASTFPVEGTTVVIPGGNGPAGVGKANGATPLVLWMDASQIGAANNARVTSWNDLSGYDYHFTGNSGGNGNGATYRANSANGYGALEFNGTSNYFSRAYTAALSPTNFSLFTANSTSNTVDEAKVIFSSFEFDGEGFIFFSRNGNWNSLTRNGPTLDLQSNPITTTWAAQTATYNKTTQQKSLLVNNSGTTTTTNVYLPNENIPIFLGGSPDSNKTRSFIGRIGEIILYNYDANSAQATIINNYLAAKYAFSLQANDVYAMDDAANNNYDYEVAGIGQAADGTNHRDAQGTGVVRMWSPQDLANNEFLMWGHDNTSLATVTSGVDGRLVHERVTRTWRVSERGDVGNTMISFDMNLIHAAGFNGSTLRLLIDRDGDGFTDNDVTPITGSYVDNKAIFAGVNLRNGDRFTLGSVENTHVPLPVSLVSFTATVRPTSILTQWETASELNNSYFDVQRSAGGEVWEQVARVNGAGTTSEAKSYQATDYAPLSGTSYYRLKQVDVDGQFAYSNVVAVNFQGEPALQVFPNPSTGQFTIAGKLLARKQVRVYSIQGQEVPFALSHQEQATLLDITSLPAGLYVVNVASRKGIQSARLVKK